MLKLGLLWFFLLANHPVHVSISSLAYDENEKLFVLFVKVYADDLQTDCRLFTGNTELILPEYSYTADNSILKDYINTKIAIEINSKALRGEITEIKLDGEEVRMVIKYRFKGKANNIRIVNTIMTDLFADQANLLIVKIGDWEEGIKFTPENKVFTINRKDTSY